MPLEAPKLDTRDFETIYNQARLRIPHYTQEWTDFNESDPGITLLQLFAWLSEMMLHEMNRVPDRNYIKFLQLLNMKLRPAEPAVAHVTFTADPAAPVDPRLGAAIVPRRSQIAAQPADGGVPLTFETESDLSLVRWPLTHVQVFDGSTIRPVDNGPGGTFAPFGWQAPLGSALYLGFEGFEPPEDTPAAQRLFPRQIVLRVFLPPPDQAEIALNCREALDPPAPPVDLVWEYKESKDAVRWRRLNTNEDKSVALTREGYISIEGPDQLEATVEGRVEEPRFWLRCRLAGRSYPAGHVPRVDFLRPNTVEAINLTTRQSEFLGESQGHPDQTFTFRYQPVQPESLSLFIKEPQDEEEQLWRMVDDLQISGEEDNDYELDATTGEILFGDGRHGRIPVAGAEIIAREYRHGGGERGNVGIGLINTLLTSVTGISAVSNERQAAGGRDEQSVDELKEDAPSQMRSRERAVTPEDFVALAKLAGGVAKATAIPLAHPDFAAGVEVPGAVTVVIMPDNEEKRPRPTADHIRAVCRYLERFRLLTTEVFVKEPNYQEIKVELKATAQPYASLDEVARLIGDKLDEFLDPMAGTFGEDFVATELYRVILEVEDVVNVPHLAIFVDGFPWQQLNRPVPVPPDGLIYSADDHEIVVKPADDQ